MTDRLTLTRPDDWHIHFRDGDKEQAMESAIRALQIDQTYQPAMQFLRQLQMEGARPQP